MLELMAQDDNAVRAAAIVRNWRHVQWHAEWDFWNELLSLAQFSYEVPNDGQFSDDDIDRMVHGSEQKKKKKKKNAYYGIWFPYWEAIWKRCQF
ncbi:MAG: hypothetical protein WKG07_45665 [Hymenobacter sp.]